MGSCFPEQVSTPLYCYFCSFPFDLFSEPACSAIWTEAESGHCHCLHHISLHHQSEYSSSCCCLTPQPGPSGSVFQRPPPLYSKSREEPSNSFRTGPSYFFPSACSAQETQNFLPGPYPHPGSQKALVPLHRTLNMWLFLPSFNFFLRFIFLSEEFQMPSIPRSLVT